MSVYKRIIRGSLQSFRRNGWLTFVSIFAMTQALFIGGLFVVLGTFVNQTIETVNAKIDLALYLEPAATQEEIAGLQNELENEDSVISVEYISKDDALERYLSQNKNSERLRQIISAEDNPLPASFEVKMDDPAHIDALVSSLENGAYRGIIAKTSFTDNEEVIKRLIAISRFVSRFSLILVVLFLLVSVLIIYNTIRVAIFARKSEIEIMKLVGATDWYVRTPFVIEGLIYGFFGALIAFGLLLTGYLILVPTTSSYLGLDVTGRLHQLFNPSFAFKLFFGEIVIGLLVGMASSFLAAKKYLDI